jgi:hypothetical protein
MFQYDYMNSVQIEFKENTVNHMSKRDKCTSFNLWHPHPLPLSVFQLRKNLQYVDKNQYFNFLRGVKYWWK